MINEHDIAPLILPYSKILDLGCGNGALIDFLRKQKQCMGYGVDIRYENIIECTKRCIPVYQGNLDEGLSAFADHSYDVVILSQTLQQVKRPLYVINEMLRVGKKGIVSFPNFAHWRTRMQLLSGNIPKTPSLPYSWAETPNIRVISIGAFRETCATHHIKILKENHANRWGVFPNFFATRGVFLIERIK